MEVSETKIVKRAIQIAEDAFSERIACWKIQFSNCNHVNVSLEIEFP